MFRLLALSLMILAGVSPAAFDARVLADESTDRKIERSDLLIIDVYDEKSLSVERRVQKSGTIGYPLLGEIDVAGKTPAEVAAILKEKLARDYLVNPQVEVLVKQYRARTVTVIGKVNRPGPVSLPEEEKMDIVQAIAQAQGFSPTANENRIIFSRAGKTTVYRFKDIKRITDETKRVWLEPGDVIDVEDSLF